MRELLDDVEQIVRQAGDSLKKTLHTALDIERKDDGSHVTREDKRVEKTLTRNLLELFDCGCMGEEFGLSTSDSDYCWVIDPIDGTANFMVGYPAFAVSVGLLHKGEPVLGVVYDPNTDYMFSASKDCGVTLNGRQIQVNKHEQLSDVSLFAIGGSKVFEQNDALNLRPARIRRIGPTTLHLCYVAAGFFDGCFEIYTKLWDIAGASCILLEAGGRITDRNQKDIFPIELTDSKLAVIASNSKVHECAIQKLTRDEYGGTN